MTEPERRAAELRTLLAWLSHQQRLLERVGRRLERAEKRAATGTDPEAVAAVALHLQHYYTAFEDALTRIGQHLDGFVPRGEDSHRLLLEQMAFDVPEVRPALLTPEMLHRLDVLRRFRHRVRHAYDVEFEWDRMTEPLEARRRIEELLPAFLARCETEVGAIIRALEGSEEK